MAKIYSQANVILSASTAASVLDGFLSTKRHPRARQWDQKHERYPRLLVPFRLLHVEGFAGTAILEEGFGSGARSKDPFMYRSWTLQERLLSRCLVIFTAHELCWQCNGAQRSCGTYVGDGEFGRPSILHLANQLEGKAFGGNGSRW